MDFVKLILNFYHITAKLGKIQYVTLDFWQSKEIPYVYCNLLTLDRYVITILVCQS